MAASLDYLKLPNSLNVLKGGLEQEMGVDREFEQWCQELTNHQSFHTAFEQLQKDKQNVLDSLAKSTKQLDMEESVLRKNEVKVWPRLDTAAKFEVDFNFASGYQKLSRYRRRGWK